jgi:chromosome segregation ATPase
MSLAIALPAAAQKIYKQQLPDGTVVYADHRIKGAKLLYQVTITDAPAHPAERAAAPASAETAALDKRLRERMAALDRAQQEIVDAGRALEVAKRRFDAEKEPLAGEVQSSAMGATRLLPQYNERLKQLEDDVAKAQARLDRAYAEKNQLR